MKVFKQTTYHVKHIFTPLAVST